MIELEPQTCPRPEVERPFDAGLWRGLERERAEAQELGRRERLAWIESGLRACLAGWPGVRAYLFGSLLRPGVFRLGSDIDVAVEGLPPREYFGLLGEIQARLQTERVDLIEMERCSFAAGIREHGCRIQ